MEDKIKCYIYPPHVCSFIYNFQLTGSTSWVEAVISTIQEKCRTEVENDENRWVDTNGTPIARILLATLCILNIKNKS
jgi:hypothetical protein